jgi:3-amino-5-hydroxybenzoic acid synthesis related protein
VQMAIDHRPMSAVIFDLDGVLINSLKAMQLAFERAYAEVVGTGYAPFEEYLRHLGRHMPDTLALMGLPQAIYEPFVRESRSLTDLVEVFAGVPQLLHELRTAGLRLAVATGKTTERAEHVIEAVGLRAYFHEVIGSDAVARGKPEPDMVLLAVDRLGVRPAHAVMVGDSPLDLQAGRAAGTRVVAAAWGEGRVADLIAAEPEALLADVPHLRTFLMGQPRR